MRAGIACLALAVLATACGGPDAEKPTEETALPTCSEVWVEGETLPLDYEGCMDGESLVLMITDASGAVSYDDRFLAQPGGTIKAVKASG